jgi:hypothetical protein
MLSEAHKLIMHYYVDYLPGRAFAICKIMDGRFQVSKQFSGSKMVLETAESFQKTTNDFLHNGSRHLPSAHGHSYAAIFFFAYVLE